MGNALNSAASSGLGLLITNVLTGVVGIGLLLGLGFIVFLAIKGKLKMWWPRIAVAFVMMVLLFDLRRTGTVIGFGERVVGAVVDWAVGLA